MELTNIVCSLNYPLLFQLILEVDGTFEFYIPLNNDQSKMIESFIRQYIEAYTGWKAGRWCFEDGCVYKGIADLYTASRDNWFFDQLKLHINRQIAPNGKIIGYDPDDYNLEDINAGKVLFLLTEKSSEIHYLIALRKLRQQLEFQPRTPSGNFQHTKRAAHQIRLESLYISAPFLARYSLAFEKGAHLADVRQQFLTTRTLLFDAKKGLYYEGYDESRGYGGLESDLEPNTVCSKFFWSQAIGWYVMALVDLCEIVGEGHGDYIFYARLLKEIVENILYFQQPEGLWMQVIDHSDLIDNLPETSASAMFAYAFLKGERLGLLSDHHAMAGRKAIEGIVARYLNLEQETYELGGICGMNFLESGSRLFTDHVGGFEDYVKMPLTTNAPQGVGPFMMAWAELLRRKYLI